MPFKPQAVLFPRLPPDLMWAALRLAIEVGEGSVDFWIAGAPIAIIMKLGQRDHYVRDDD
jgi:hypothetical protein